MKMTITRALSEAKLTKQKLDKALDDIPSPVDIYVNGVGSTLNQSKEEFIKAFQSSEDKYHDLSLRLDKLKIAIAKANTEVMVSVPDFKGKTKKQVSIYQAILLKDSYIELMKNYIILREKCHKVKNKFDNEMSKLDDKVQKVIEQLYGNKASQISKDSISRTREDAESAYKIEYVEALKKEDLENYISTLDNMIIEIDLTLSEVNASTIITVED